MSFPSFQKRAKKEVAADSSSDQNKHTDHKYSHYYFQMYSQFETELFAVIKAKFYCREYWVVSQTTGMSQSCLSSVSSMLLISVVSQLSVISR